MPDTMASGLSVLIHSPVVPFSFQSIKHVTSEDNVIIDGHLITKAYLKKFISKVTCRRLVILVDEKFSLSGIEAIFIPATSGIADIALVCKQLLFMHRPEDWIKPFDSFSVLEERILHYISLGKSDKEIAICINHSLSYIKYHLRKLYKKLGVKNRTQAALKLFENSV